MRADCIKAVSDIATSIGKKLTVEDLRGIEDKIYQARKQLAKKDRDAYNAMDSDQQLKEAGEMVVNQAIHDASTKKLRVALNIKKQAEADSVMKKMMDSGMNQVEALRYYTQSIQDGRGGFISYEAMSHGISNYYMGKLADFQKLRQDSSFMGIMASSKNMNDFVKESFGLDSGNQLAKKAWLNVDKVRSEMIRHFNRIGGDIPKLANYRNPQALDTFRTSRVDQKAFIDDFMQWIDRSEYVNANGKMMTDDEVKSFLQETHVTVVTDGANKPIGEGLGSASNRMKAHRQIHYKSPEAYMAAMDKYGAGNAFDQTISHIDSLANNIALLERFGPSAERNFDRMYQKAALETGKTDNLLVSGFKRMSGQIGTENAAIAHYAGEFRSAMVGAKLGSMLLSQMSDLGTFEGAARAMNIPMSEVMGWVKNVAADGNLRDTLRIHGYGVESALNTIARFSDNAMTTGFFGKTASAIPTIQGAHLWTQSLRQAFGAMMEAKMGDVVSKYADMKSLPDADKRRMEALGVTDADFAIWKISKPFEYKGNKLLNAESISNTDLKAVKDALGLNRRKAEKAIQDSAMKFVSLVTEQTHQAVLQPSSRTMAHLSGSEPRGSVKGEIGSMIFQFKGFPLAFFKQVLVERANFKAAGYNPLVFRAKMVAATTMLGGLSLVLGDLASGKDPRDLNAKFGLQAFLKGGGMGIFNEIIEAGVGSVESPWASGTKMLGPGLGYLAGTAIPTVAHGLDYAASEIAGEPDEKAKRNFTKNLYSSATGITPGQNLWFLKGFLHNILLDDFQEMSNPGYKGRAKERAAKAGSEYWLGMD